MTSQFPSFYDVRNVINSSSKLKTHQLMNNFQTVNIKMIVFPFFLFPIFSPGRPIVRQHTPKYDVLPSPPDKEAIGKGKPSLCERLRLRFLKKMYKKKKNYKKL